MSWCRFRGHLRRDLDRDLGGLRLGRPAAKVEPVDDQSSRTGAGSGSSLSADTRWTSTTSAARCRRSMIRRASACSDERGSRLDRCRRHQAIRLRRSWSSDKSSWATAAFPKALRSATGSWPSRSRTGSRRCRARCCSSIPTASGSATSSGSASSRSSCASRPRAASSWWSTRVRRTIPIRSIPRARSASSISALRIRPVAARPAHQPRAVQLDFAAFNDQKDALLRGACGSTGPGASVAQDLEPEALAIAPDGRRAWVSLQRNNAMAVIDLRARGSSTFRAWAPRITAGPAPASMAATSTARSISGPGRSARSTRPDSFEARGRGRDLPGDAERRRSA